MFGSFHLFMVMSISEFATTMEQQPLLKFAQGKFDS